MMCIFIHSVPRFVRTGSTNATKEILQLKDHLVELERRVKIW